MSTLRRRPEVAVAALTSLLLLALAGRYGYHRDELYFLACGRHLAWGYPDQPPLVPAVARLMSTIAPDSLVALRLPSALIGGTVVLLAGEMARLLGARLSGRALAAGATALSGFVLAMGHLLSTATFDLLGWTLLTLIVLRVLLGRSSGPRPWLTAGLVAGLTLQANVLVAFLLLVLVVSLLAVGPRRVLASPWPWVAAVVAFALGAPYLLWQASHGWPQLDIAGNIAAGGSGSSVPRVAFVPLVLLQVGPWLAPLWIGGLLRLSRASALRSLAATFGVLVVVFLVTGGKPYYLAGLYPLLLAAGAQPLLDRARPWVPATLLVLSLPVLVVTLPILPVRSAQPAIEVNYDLGETIGWPQHVAEIAAAYRRLPADTRILTGNYGEAGAVDRYGPAFGLPHAYSGHNAYASWGHPAGSTPVLALGIDASTLADVCARLDTVGRLGQPYGIDNDEDGTVLRYCVPARPWSELWPQVTDLG